MERRSICQFSLIIEQTLLVVVMTERRSQSQEAEEQIKCKKTQLYLRSYIKIQQIRKNTQQYLDKKEREKENSKSTYTELSNRDKEGEMNL